MYPEDNFRFSGGSVNLVDGSFVGKTLDQYIQENSSQSFKDWYLQDIEQYKDTEFYDELRANPWLDYNYTPTFWDALGSSTGLWHSGEDAIRMDYEQKARDHYAQLLDKMRTQEHNSEANSVARLRAAGQNPDLTGIPDSAGQVEDSPVSLPPTDFGALPGVQDFAQAGLSLVNTLVGGITAFKQLGLMDSQIALQSSQVGLQSSQASLVDKQNLIADIEAAGHEITNLGQLHDLAKRFARSFYSSEDERSSYQDWLGLSSPDDVYFYAGKQYKFSDLPDAAKMSLFMQSRAEKIALPSIPRRYQGEFVNMLRQFSSPNNDELRAWKSQLDAQVAQNDLTALQTRDLIAGFSDGIGKLQYSAFSSKFRLDKELNDYQRDLYRKYRQKGVLDAASDSEYQAQLARGQEAIYNKYRFEFQQNTQLTLLKMQKSMLERNDNIGTFGSLLIPAIMPSIETFGNSLFGEFGAMLGNPMKNFTAPALSAIGSLF